LFGSSNAHKALRKTLVEEHKLEAVISLPAGVFRPYAGVSTGILVFTKTGVGGTDQVWFYDMTADGWSLDDRRNPLLTPEKLGVHPELPLSDDEHEKNNLPDVLARWLQRDAGERDRVRMAQSFCVDKTEIAAKQYDLAMSRYKEAKTASVMHAAPCSIVADLKRLESEITDGLEQCTAPRLS